MTPFTPMPAAMLAAALVLAAAPARAQLGNPAGTTPASAAPAPSAEPNSQDRLYVRLVGQGGLAEVGLARLAEGRAAHDGVRHFARRMDEEHGQGNAQLADAARQAGLEAPSRPSADQEAMRQRLQALDGPAFDAAYLDGQMAEHQKTVQLLLWELNSGQTPSLQRHAAASLPVVLDHLEQVQQLRAQLLGTGAR